jgi:hypothetical protein
VEMDRVATVYWDDTKPLVLPFYPPSSYGWSIWVDTRNVASWDRQSLYNYAQSTPILEHWSKRRNIPHHLIRSTCEHAIKVLCLTRSLWIPKWLAGFAPVGKVQQRNPFQDHAECPRCSAFESTTAHVLLCPAPQAQCQWDSSLSSLDQWFAKALHYRTFKMQSSLASTRGITKMVTPPAPSYNWPGVNDIILDQDAVGWRAFLEGVVLHAWAAKQQEYYNWIKHRNTGKRWITNLIKKLWEISWNMWEQRNGEVNNLGLPASLQLHVRGATISAHYRIEIEKEANTTNLREYIRSKNEWTNKQMAYINWDAHGKALARLAQQHTQLVKMCHKILPRATITSRYKSTASPLCPICKANNEDRDHVMRCADSKKAKWRHQLIGTVQKRCTKMKTREMLTMILTDSLMQWFNDKQIQPAAYPAPFHRLIKQKIEIGWRQLFNGRFSSEWQQLQDQHLRSNGIK